MLKSISLSNKMIVTLVDMVQYRKSRPAGHISPQWYNLNTIYALERRKLITVHKKRGVIITHRGHSLYRAVL